MSKKNRPFGNIVFSTNNDWQPEQEKNITESLLPQQQMVKVRTDKKHRAGKIVTLVEGLVMNQVQIEELTKLLKSYCGSGGSVKDQVIIIQGDHSQKIVDWLHKNDFVRAKKIQ
ncbi:MAG: translation initiation factor [Ginsengibacter sp.]